MTGSQGATREDWIRLAALIDGEGAISIGVGSTCNNHSLRVEVYNTDVRLPMWCWKVFGGALRAHDRRGRRRKTLYRWQVVATQAEEVLKGCYEFFLIKKEQADVAFRFRKTFARRSTKRLSQQLRDERLACRDELSRIKIQGFIPGGVLIQ